MSAALIADLDVINSATPLEMKFTGVHPRLYLTADGFQHLAEPNQPALVQRTVDSLLEAAEKQLPKVCPKAMGDDPDPRGFGTGLPCLALAWRLTGDARFRKAALDCMATMEGWQNWGNDLIFGHFAHGYAVALDWMWHDIDTKRRDTMIDCLARNVTVLFDDWRSYASGASFSYTWNHHTVPLSGLTAGACVLYGERPEVSPWLNMALEKVRCITAALGPDGVSPESMAYGAYFSHYLMRCLRLLRELGGVDLLSDTKWWQEYSLALVHHTLPRRHWSPQSAFIMLGDTNGRHWYGPDPVCHICATEFGDGHAQWLANSVVADGASETAGERIISLGMLDPNVDELPPNGLPTFVLFADQGLAIGRSDWSGEETVWAIRSGPPMAYSGHAKHRNPIAGGHMHAFAGTFQVFAHGDYVIAPAGYTQKWTHYHNTLLINGQGQFGESDAWYEDLPFRQGRALPSLTVVADSPTRRHLLAEMTPAYADELGLARVKRHFISVAGDCWVIVDVVDAREPVVVDVLFHTGFPLRELADGSYSGEGKEAAATLSTLWPPAASSHCSMQTLLHTNTEPENELDLLTVTAPAASHSVVVTMLRVGRIGDALDVNATVTFRESHLLIELPSDLRCPALEVSFVREPS